MIPSPAEALEVWNKAARRQLRRAIKRTRTLMSDRDVEAGLRSGEMALWRVECEKEGGVAYFVTEIVRASNGAAVNVVGIGGRGVTKWIAFVTKALRQYARRMGCLYVVEFGRPGWIPVLSRQGWTRGPVAMLLEVA